MRWCNDWLFYLMCQGERIRGRMSDCNSSNTYQRVRPSMHHPQLPWFQGYGNNALLHEMCIYDITNGFSAFVAAMQLKSGALWEMGTSDRRLHRLSWVHHGQKLKRVAGSRCGPPGGRAVAIPSQSDISAVLNASVLHRNAHSCPRTILEHLHPKIGGDSID